MILHMFHVMRGGIYKTVSSLQSPGLVVQNDPPTEGRRLMQTKLTMRRLVVGKQLLRREPFFLFFDCCI